MAHLDHESEEVLGVRTLVTPQPARRLGPGWDSEAEEARSRLSARLKSVARELVPRRTWTGTGWSIPAGRLFTVVCRDGRVVDTATEWQFHSAWLFSNHLTAAFFGDVYVVTPHGWTGCLDHRAGVDPVLDPASTPGLG